MTERTQTQGDEELQRAAKLSQGRRQPPTTVPGCETERFLGAGAYGEVWVALDRNTGRRVAIKFFLHRGGLDWSQLSREVEKLVFLSADRYVVQLLDVGWEADPPYYVMEYLPEGSLDDYLREQGPLPVGEALELFREVTIGLVHAHGRGVLHCDLKPANVLLDQDHRPRLADFGQSRLSHEQKPALGTLFYMAPEQADMKAVPDARWDVYALGALLFTMLTGAPPHREDSTVSDLESAADLDDRLARYRHMITQSPRPAAQLVRKDLDRSLLEILDRCLAIEPDARYPNVQSVLDALDDREARRARRPLVLLGMIGPILMVLLMGFAAWKALDTTVEQTDASLTTKAVENNRFAAELAAVLASNELDRRFRAVEQIAQDPSFQVTLADLLAHEEFSQIRDSLNDPQQNPTLADSEITTKVLNLRQSLRNHKTRQKIQEIVERLSTDADLPRAASWFVDDPQGLQIARFPRNTTIGRNYAWRTYFHGEGEDKPHDWRPSEGEHVQKTKLSAALLSQASGRWILGISTPVYQNQKFLGVVALTVEVGGPHFGVRLREASGSAKPNQFAVLVDWREGPNKGLVLQHPLLEADVERSKELQIYRLAGDSLPSGEGPAKAKAYYTDPLSLGPSGQAYQGRWLADSAPVPVRGKDSHLRVIVQERHNHAIEPTLKRLRKSLQSIGLIALSAVAFVLTALWGFVIRGFHRSRKKAGRIPELANHASIETMATIAFRDDERP